MSNTLKIISHAVAKVLHDCANSLVILQNLKYNPSPQQRDLALKHLENTLTIAALSFSYETPAPPWTEVIQTLQHIFPNLSLTSHHHTDLKGNTIPMAVSLIAQMAKSLRGTGQILIHSSPDTCSIKAQGEKLVLQDDCLKILTTPHPSPHNSSFITMRLIRQYLQDKKISVSYKKGQHLTVSFPILKD